MLKNIFKNIVSHSPNSNLRSNLLTYVSILSKQLQTMTCATFHSFHPNKMFRSGRDWTNLCFIFIFYFTKLLQHFRVPNIRSLTHSYTHTHTPFDTSPVDIQPKWNNPFFRSGKNSDTERKARKNTASQSLFIAKLCTIQRSLLLAPFMFFFPFPHFKVAPLCPHECVFVVFLLLSQLLFVKKSRTGKWAKKNFFFFFFTFNGLFPLAFPAETAHSETMKEE